MKKQVQTQLYPYKGEKRVVLDKYAGQWVALADEGVVAYSKSLSELMKKTAKKKTRKRPIVMLVPRKDEGPYILFFV